MGRAKFTIAGLCLAFAALTQSGCLVDTGSPRLYSSDGAENYYGQTQPYQYRAYQYPDPYVWQRPYGSPWLGQRPYWNAPQPRVFSPDPGVRCDRRKEVCYKWHDRSGEWRPDRSDTKDTFGKKAARRLNQ